MYTNIFMLSDVPEVLTASRTVDQKPTPIVVIRPQNRKSREDYHLVDDLTLYEGGGGKSINLQNDFLSVERQLPSVAWDLAPDTFRS